jgi:maltose O-acetyltransferase
MKFFKIDRFICRLLYLCFARYLPYSYSRYNFGAQKVRAYLASKMLMEVGKNINIEKGAMFNCNIKLGDNSGLGINCRLPEGPITIGNNVMMGQDVIIHTRNHKHDRLDIPMNEQGFEQAKPVTIGNDVWIGSRVIILPGVTIGDGCIIGAGAVVTKNIEPFSIAAGNPAKIVKMRKQLSILNEDKISKLSISE